ncbi:hypothetical protein [Rothia nasimurium]|uniref:hypothetical protein n=1 Tax=Rothia nasimurium TaxID=85336 RepID=UPI001F3C6E27|nr:hypothetical protein [Rothia nasimurium]
MGFNEQQRILYMQNSESMFNLIENLVEIREKSSLEKADMATLLGIDQDSEEYNDFENPDLWLPSMSEIISYANMLSCKIEFKVYSPEKIRDNEVIAQILRGKNHEETNSNFNAITDMGSHDVYIRWNDKNFKDSILSFSRSIKSSTSPSHHNQAAYSHKSTEKFAKA